MLVATQGQTASYPLHNNAPKKLCHSSATTSKTSNNGLNAQKIAARPLPIISKLSESTASVSAAATLMKTFTVRINRGTELLVDNVKKALQSNSNNTASYSAVANSTTSSAAKKFPSSSFLKMYTVPPTYTHRFPEERADTSSTDSLQKELCHFKPISPANRTPLKSGIKSRVGALLKKPRASFPSDDRLDSNCDYPLADDNAVYTKSYTLIRPTRSSSFSLSNHKSAFVCLITTKAEAEALKDESRSEKFELDDGKTRRSQRKVSKNALSRRAANLLFPELMANDHRNTFENAKELPPTTTKAPAKRDARKKRSKPYTVESTIESPLINSKNNNRSRLGTNRTKSKIIKTAPTKSTENTRKRKMNCKPIEMSEEEQGEEDASPATQRKKSRLSKDCNDMNNIAAGSSAGSNRKASTGKRQSLQLQNKLMSQSFSPPVTRARMRQMSNTKLNGELDNRRRGKV